ncbi:hypothetical protein BCR42DRAFT_402695 [Absidia repens]|uniref:C2H2-type domain-containing protein n=1 Tax=Absidia repens TaxID=90262 RepID=A0A1X2IYB6_9FUNG|nr:hypothetical protein BCR42DRAFT_402695 [Absidia repens]
MTSLHVCFSNNPVKSQPEVGLSLDFLDFGQLGHDFTRPTSIPIPPNAIPLNATDYRPELDSYDLTSFGSFSSAAESLVHDHAIVIPAYSPPSTPAATTQDFCLLDEQEPALAASETQLYSELQPQDTPSALLSSSSTSEQDISTPLTAMLSPYGFYVDDMMLMSSPSSPGSWLTNSIESGLYIQSPSTSHLFGMDSSASANPADQLQIPPQQHSYYASSYSSSSSVSQASVATPSAVPQHHDSANNIMDWSLHQDAPTDYHMDMMTTMTATPAANQVNNGNDNSVGLHSMVESETAVTQDPVFLQHHGKSTPVMGKKHSRRREYECPHCHRKSNRSNNMKEHILTHNPNRPKNFPCTLCPKRFARKHDLKRHHQSHERSIEKMMVACGLVPGATSISL